MVSPSQNITITDCGCCLTSPVYHLFMTAVYVGRMFINTCLMPATSHNCDYMWYMVNNVSGLFLILKRWQTPTAPLFLYGTRQSTKRGALPNKNNPHLVKLFHQGSGNGPSWYRKWAILPPKWKYTMWHKGSTYISLEVVNPCLEN